MDDLAGKLSEILNNPEIMQQVQGLTGLLGQPQPEEGEYSQPQQEKESSKSSFPSGDTTQMLLKLAPIISSINTDDKYTLFLQALRPLLHEPRQKKLDEASKILQLIKILPILKNQGLI